MSVDKSFIHAFWSFIFVVTFLTGCHIVEVNMVQRAIIEEGDGIASTHENAEQSDRKDSDAMQFVVPLK